MEVAGTTRISSMLLSHDGSTNPSQCHRSQVVPYLSRLAVSDKQLYWRLAASLTFMIVSKAAGEQACIVLDYTPRVTQKTQRAMHIGLMAPLFMKRSVDALSGTITQLAVQASVLSLLWSGACRVVNSVAREAQGPIFTPVAQVWRSPSHLGPDMHCTG